MTTADPQFEGVYGPYSITETDRRDVQRCWGIWWV